MKLRIVPASQGLQWVKSGVWTFFRQPLALSGLFFIFMALMSVLSMIPVLGSALALAVLPGATLGLLAASEEASKGKFPMPTILLSAFRAERKTLRPMLILGAYYAAGFLLVMGATALVDGGQLAKMYLLGGKITDETLKSEEFKWAAVTAMTLYIPLSLLFWHAPALVYWHKVSPAKSLFFSFMACQRHFWAYTVYATAWMVISILMGVVIATVALATGNAELVANLVFPCVLLMAAMFFTSIYFTFVGSFDLSTDETP
jgi:hypothetical protein